jgi:hypothetical protein
VGSLSRQDAASIGIVAFSERGMRIIPGTEILQEIIYAVSDDRR